jgi:hypothetical protein
MTAVVLILYGVALVASLGSLALSWSTGRLLKREEERMDRIEDTVRKLEGRRSLRPTRPDPGRNYQ